MKHESSSDNSHPDAALGRAVRTSAFMLVTLGLLAGIVFWFTKHQPETVDGGNSSGMAASSDIPAVSFRDVTREAGIDFVHVNGAQGDKLLPETMGGGVAFFDGDQDGDQDLLFMNGMDWPSTKSPSDSPPTMALYWNDGAGQFTVGTPGSGLDVSCYGMGVAVGDYDDDGRVDVFVTAVGVNRLFHNQGGGRFREVTDTAGVAGDEDAWSTSAAFLDIDQDGDLDLFVCNYVRWSRAIDLGVDYQLPGIGRAYGPPMDFAGTFPYLYRNEGQGRFTDISAVSGVQITNRATGQPMAKSLGVAPVDIDQDGWMDLVVANDTVQNFVFRNRGNGTFEEIGSKSGIAFDSFGQTRGAMGIDAARLGNDRSLGIAIGNFANEMNALYLSKRERERDTLLFADEAIAAGVGPASQHLLKFGLFFFDFDLDGRLDVLTANGHLEEKIHLFRADQEYRQPAQLFWNRGLKNGVGFLPVPETMCGPDLFEPMVGRGSAYADMDGDGDLDVILTQIGGPPKLLRNGQSLDHHWARLKLVGRRGNRDAIGAWVRLRVGDRVLSRQVMPTRGYLSQSELPLTFGLNRASRIDRVEVQWPDGSEQVLLAVPVDRLTVVEQGD